VIVDAKVTALDLFTDEKYEAASDDLGDFFIRGLKSNHGFLVTVEKDGYRKGTLGVVKSDKDKSLGEIKLYKE
jgi:cellulase/cellobiase CelA1